MEEAPGPPADAEAIARPGEVAKLKDWQAQLDTMSSHIETQTRARSRARLSPAPL